MNKLFVITGPDASGKDTQIELLRKALQASGRKTQILSIQTSIKEFISDVEEKDIYAVLNVFLNKFDPLARTLFLQSLILNAFNHLDANADIVLFNGYWYKYAASEKCYGIDSDLWKTFARSHLPTPNKVISIDVSLENCLKRRTRWSSYEQGHSPYMSAPDSKQNQLHFLEFQKQMHFNLKTIINYNAPFVCAIDGNNPAFSVAQTIQKIFGVSSIPESRDLEL